MLQSHDFRVNNYRTTIIPQLHHFCFTNPMKKQLRWDQKNGLIGVTVYLTPKEKAALKALARDADKSVALYLRRLVEQHIRAHKPPES